ncbi:MAG: lysine--tRNA ligase [Candidatus Zambryskibacteria bacterium CG_4_9_14_3_um_filter_42_9]|nr:MAG: lysine--tRNA ligase [Candidatus Zambryskibacteria bacterium CG_4_9_14_3_um_filter_42_9]
MASLEEIRSARLAKLKFLSEQGIDPYPSSARRDITCGESITRFSELAEGGQSLYMAGRIMSLRAQGKIIFFDIDDGTGRFQAFLKKGEPLKAKSFELFEKAFDIGDFVEVKGTFFLTKKEEKTVLVEEVRMLAKSLRPLPEKWHGLQDVEERFRKRYLDILSNSQVKELFIKRARFWDVTREFFKKEGFLEVETPTLEITTGGAEARPFKTHHHDFDMGVYLRISVGELWQKRLMASGFNKTFEIGRVYRNEGSSPEHLQEFTNLEFYWSYADYHDGMELVKRLYRTIASEVFGTTKFRTRGHSFDLGDEWRKIDYVEEIKSQTRLDITNATEGNMKEKLEELGVSYEGSNKERLIDSLWKYSRKNIAGPAFLINHPVIVGPLAKLNPDGKTVQIFQPILAGSEVGKGYSELNDPIDQEARFKIQQKLIESGDEEAMMADSEFVEMLEYGMPPTCGFGFGERLFAFLVDKPLRETHLFPLMRPKD